MSRINIHFVGPKHKILGERQEVFKSNLPLAGKRWTTNHTGAADFAVVATKDRKVIGFVRVTQESKRSYTFAGTWVDAAFRGQGLASRLWKKLLTRFTPGDKLAVTTISAGGEALVKKFVALHPEFKWEL